MAASRTVALVRIQILALLLFEALSAATPTTRNADDPYRLGESVWPDQYFIRLQPNLESGTFHGQVTILVKAKSATDTITLHSEGNTVRKISVKASDDLSDENEIFLKYEIDEEHEFLILHLSKSLDPANKDGYTIVIEYDGTLREDMYGFYISKYHDPVERKVAATHFQPTHARKAFPCFDEPRFKARFQVTLAVQGFDCLGWTCFYECLSNMPLKSSSTEDNIREYIFENSFIMSTYLVAFVAIDFGAMGSMSHDQIVRLNSWSRNAIDKQALYSLDVTADTLLVMEEFTDFSYTGNDEVIALKKLDQVALPDFPAGAMENWGLILYRESRLLLGANSSRDDINSVATVIAHEISHQWFGNLVTTAWWDALWLNEGFATYFESYAIDMFEPSFRKMDLFVVGDLQAVMVSDAAISAQPLTYSVSSASQTRSRFNTISYSKGGVFLRMISSIIGSNNFREALRSYLKNNKYDSVEPRHFFQEITAYVGETGLTKDVLEDFLDKWTTVPGFPVVHVQRSYDDRTALVTQKRFLYAGEGSEVYYVPLTWTDESLGFTNLKPKQYISPSDSSVNIEGLPNAENWVIFNVQESGYYRVNYDERNWQLIIDYLKNYNHPLDNIHVLNRAQLLDDAFNLARAGQLPYATAFDLAAYLPREHDYVPWAAALSAFSYLDRMFATHEKYPLLQRYIRRLVMRQYQRFEFGYRISEEERDHADGLLFNRIMTWTCATDHDNCKRRATNEFMAFMNSENNEYYIQPDLRSVAYCQGIKNTPAFREWDEFFDIYNTSDVAAEKARIARGLACTTEADYLKRLLSYAIDGVHVRKQDAASIFSYVYATPAGAEVALEFLGQHFEEAEDYLYININNNINNVISGIANRFTTYAQKKLIENFVTEFRDHLGETGSSFLNTVQNNIDWVANNQERVFSALERFELEQYRLPGNVVPRNYKVFITPELDVRRFRGEVGITVEVLDATDTITLHSSVFSLATISVHSAHGEELLDYVSEDSDLELLHIYLKDIVPKGPYYITINYDGTLRNDMYGLYYSTYRTKDGEPRTLLATQFQPTHARKAFPCFDEPQYKATFDITINNPSGLLSISNMPSEDSPARMPQTTFSTTMKMSTYLVAFVVSDFDYIEKVNGVTLRTWSRPDALPWAAYSIEVTPKLLSALEEYTNIKYTDAHENLNKLDQVAIPDFSAGAMENWGLITYRETALLYNDGPAAARKRVANTIAHELVHMWFGNLVTTKSWDSTWLNEGFAQYFQFYATSHAEPEWRILDQFVVDVQQTVYRSDMLASAEPLTARAYTPAQISARFGTITYSKGASFIRMLNSVLGPEAFQLALRNYLHENKFSATEPKDLFKYLQEQASASGLNSGDMEAFLKSWTEQPGFPVLSVSRTNNGRTATVSQKRFLSIDTSEDNTLYYVPLTWVKQGESFEDRRPQDFLRNNASSIIIENMPGEDSWVIFNVQETGYYRVNYDERNWALIAKHLAQGGDAIGAIHVLNRAQLIDDAFNLARGGHLPYATAFDLADYLQHEADFIPWTAAATTFNFLDVMLAGHDNYSVFQRYILHLLDHQYERFKFDDRETHEEKLHLSRIISLACNHGHDHCRESAKTKLGEYLNNSSIVPADLRSVVYCHGVSDSTDHWDHLWEKYKLSSDDAERALIVTGLGCSTDSETLKKYLQHSIDGLHIRRQDASSVFTAVYTTRFGVEVALEFLDEKFEEILEYYGSMGAINNIVTGIAARLTTDDQKRKLEVFVHGHDNVLGTAGSSALETVQGNLNWLSKNADVIIKILENKESSTTAGPPTEPPTTTGLPTDTPTTTGLSTDTPTTTGLPTDTPTTTGPTSDPSTTENPSTEPDGDGGAVVISTASLPLLLSLTMLAIHLC